MMGVDDLDGAAMLRNVMVRPDLDADTLTATADEA
jgi:hypothetical protein